MIAFGRGFIPESSNKTLNQHLLINFELRSWLRSLICLKAIINFVWDLNFESICTDEALCIGEISPGIVKKLLRLKCLHSITCSPREKIRTNVYFDYNRVECAQQTARASIAEKVYWKKENYKSANIFFGGRNELQKMEDLIKIVYTTARKNKKKRHGLKYMLRCLLFLSRFLWARFFDRAISCNFQGFGSTFCK